MGGSQSVFSVEELQEYEELTFLSKMEILQAFKRFRNLSPQKVDENKNAVLTPEEMAQFTELKNNPFRDRILIVFSSNGDGYFCFEDFLEMVSAFSDKASKAVKTTYAFKIYDFDNDEAISRSDLRTMLDHLFGKDQDTDLMISAVEKKRLIDEIIREGDIDQDDLLNFSEFEHVLSKSPDFERTFRLVL